MPLPIVNIPSESLTIPSTKKTVRFRPYLAGEEMILLLAVQSNNESKIANAIKDVLKACLCTINGEPLNSFEIDVDKMPLFDLEYFFLKLRCKSVGERVIAHFKCENIVADAEGKKAPCDHIVGIGLNLDDFEVEFPDKDYSTVQLNEEIGVKMRYPTFELLEKISSMQQGKSDLETAFDVIGRCVQFVFDKETTYETFTQAEMQKFLKSLTQAQFDKLREFFDHMPRLRRVLTFKCPKCQFKDEIVLEGLRSLFV